MGATIKIVSDCKSTFLEIGGKSINKYKGGHYGQRKGRLPDEH